MRLRHDPGLERPGYIHTAATRRWSAQRTRVDSIGADRPAMLRKSCSRSTAKCLKMPKAAQASLRLSVAGPHNTTGN